MKTSLILAAAIVLVACAPLDIKPGPNHDPFCEVEYDFPEYSVVVVDDCLKPIMVKDKQSPDDGLTKKKVES